MEAKRLQAASLGLSHYQGAACKKCGNTDRFVSNGSCVSCNRDRAREVARKNRELIAQLRERANGGV